MSSFSHEALFNLEATDEELSDLLYIFVHELNGTGEQLIRMIALAPMPGIADHTARLLKLIGEGVRKELDGDKEAL